MSNLDRLDPVSVASKADFLKKYVLNRALANDGTRGLSGNGAAIEAIRAWDTIEKELKARP